MKKKVLLLAIISTFLVVGCESGYKEGKVVRIDYQGAEVQDGDWVQIDSFRFEHIGRREEAKAVRYPLPSNEVFVDSTGSREFSRDYNPKVIPVMIAKHLDKVNKKLPAEKKFRIESHAVLTYRGVLELYKADSSTIKVSTSEGYGPKVSVVK